MNFRQIECFLIAAKCLNFSEASEKLFISQPTFSRTMSAIEAELGMTLLNRGYKSTRLTPGGAVLYEGLTQLMCDYEKILSEAQNAARGYSGVLSIGLLDGQIIHDSLLKILHFLNAEYPHVKVKLVRYSLYELLEYLSEGTIDVAITLSLDVVGINHLNFEILYSLPNCLVVSKDHNLANRTDVNLIDFKDDTFISLSDKESTAFHQMLLNSCKAAGFEPHLLIAADVKDQSLLLEAGYGVAIFAKNSIACYNPTLKAMFLPELHETASVVAWQQDNQNPIVDLFIKLMKNHQSYSASR